MPSSGLVDEPLLLYEVIVTKRLVLLPLTLPGAEEEAAEGLRSAVCIGWTGTLPGRVLEGAADARVLLTDLLLDVEVRRGRVGGTAGCLRTVLVESVEEDLLWLLDRRGCGLLFTVDNGVPFL